LYKAMYEYEVEITDWRRIKNVQIWCKKS
jgi:hypothetical protein